MKIEVMKIEKDATFDKCAQGSNCSCCPPPLPSYATAWNPGFWEVLQHIDKITEDRGVRN